MTFTSEEKTVVRQMVNSVTRVSLHLEGSPTVGSK